MNRVLLIIAKIINNVFGYSMGKYRYFKSWKYIHTISLMGIGRIQGNPIGKSGELDVLKKIIRSSDNRTVILDVGANKGQYTEAALSMKEPGKKLEIHLFEPSAINVGILKEKFNDATCDGNIFIINELALSDKAETSYLYTDEEGSDLGSLLQLKIPIRPFDDAKKESIQTITLDEYFSRHRLESVELLKIDVEGGEYMVLSGAKKVLRERRIKNIQFEFGAGNITSRIFFHDFWEMLSEWYHFSLVLEGGTVPVEKYSTDWEIFRTVNYLLTLKES